MTVVDLDINLSEEDNMVKTAKKVDDCADEHNILMRLPA